MSANLDHTSDALFHAWTTELIGQLQVSAQVMSTMRAKATCRYKTTQTTCIDMLYGLGRQCVYTSSTFLHLYRLNRLSPYFPTCAKAPFVKQEPVSPKPAEANVAKETPEVSGKK